MMIDTKNPYAYTNTNYPVSRAAYVPPVSKVPTVNRGAEPDNQYLSICPDCVKSSILDAPASGITYGEKNPYEQARKTIESSYLSGQNLDLSA